MSEERLRLFMKRHADTHEALTRLDYRNDDWAPFDLEAELAKKEGVLGAPPEDPK